MTNDVHHDDNDDDDWRDGKSLQRYSRSVPLSRMSVKECSDDETDHSVLPVDGKGSIISLCVFNRENRCHAVFSVSNLFPCGGKFR